VAAIIPSKDPGIHSMKFHIARRHHPLRARPAQLARQPNHINSRPTSVPCFAGTSFTKHNEDQAVQQRAPAEQTLDSNDDQMFKDGPVFQERPGKQWPSNSRIKLTTSWNANQDQRIKVRESSERIRMGIFNIWMKTIPAAPARCHRTRPRFLAILEQMITRISPGRHS